MHRKEENLTKNSTKLFLQSSELGLTHPPTRRRVWFETYL
jgi:hypothetical protein